MQRRRCIHMSQLRSSVCTSASRKHKFKTGGARPDMDKMYKGRCCGGDKVYGDGKLSKCMHCPYQAYLCGSCRKESAATPAEPDALCLEAVVKAGSVPIRADIAMSIATVPSEPEQAAAVMDASDWDLMDSAACEEMMQNVEKKLKT